MIGKVIRGHGGYTSKRFSDLFKTFTALHGTSAPETKSATIDMVEVSHFNSLSSSWWDELGNAKALHSMNKLRIPLIRDGLINSGSVTKDNINGTKPLKDLNILEVGCGGGILTEPLAKLGANVTGIDVSQEMIDIAVQHSLKYPKLNIKYSLESVEEHVRNNTEMYDAVVASEVLEHTNDQRLFVESCVKTLKSNGSIFITTMNKTTLSWLGGIIFAENILNFVPKGTHDWNKFIAPHQTQRILEDYKCRTKLIHGLCYNFCTNSWSWITDTSVNYALHAVKD